MARVSFRLIGLASALFLTCGSLASNVRSEAAVVFVNEVPVLRLATPSGRLSPVARAEKLVRALSQVPSIGKVIARKEGLSFILVAPGQPLLEVTAEEAHAQKSSIAWLALSWAKKMRAAALLPPIKLSENSIRLPLGSSKEISIVGSMARSATASAPRDGVVSMTQTPATIKIQGTIPGRTQIRVDAGTNIETIDVEVKPYAAIYPQNLTAQVTGAPAHSDTVRGSIESALQMKFVAQPNAKWTFEVKNAKPVLPGQAATFPVRVWTGAPNAFSSSGLVNVVVRNIALGRVDEGELWYSNDPESVRQPGPLFSAALKRGSSSRLLYHHVNESSQAMILRLQVINDNDQEARIMLIPGDSKPDRNPVRAGMAAADEYVRNWMTGSGEIVVIPPHSSLPISLRRLSPKETVSGLCTIRMVDGPPDILIRSDAWPPFPLDARWLSATRTSTPWREVGTQPISSFDRAPSELSQHIYPNPFREETVAYAVGGRYGFIRIGQRPIARQDNEGALDGNFGVIYNIKAKVENKTADATECELVFEASAGYSGGLFMVDGQLLQTPLLQPKGEIQLKKFRLIPGATRSFDIVTLPLSGGSYPCTLTIRPVQNVAYGG